MAGTTVTRRSVASEVATILDSPEVTALVAELDALRWTGRKGYGARTLIGACLVKSLYGLPTWTLAAALIAEHPGLQAALGGAPSCWACYRFCEKLRANRELMKYRSTHRTSPLGPTSTVSTPAARRRAGR